MKCAAILAAGGSGSRASADIPKQLLPLGGRPLFVWSLNVLGKVERIREIVVAVPSGRTDQFQKAARGIPNVKWTVGGARRQDSVMAGLRAVSSDMEIILVHDAARPFITPQLLDLLIEAAAERGAAIPVAPVTETLKEVSHSRVIGTVDRSRIFCAQTPQAFRYEVLLRVFESVPQDREWTDEASMCESAGVSVTAVAGDRRNIKITYAGDFEYAEYLLSHGREA